MFKGRPDSTLEEGEDVFDELKGRRIRARCTSITVRGIFVEVSPEEVGTRNCGEMMLTLREDNYPTEAYYDKLWWETRHAAKG